MIDSESKTITSIEYHHGFRLSCGAVSKYEDVGLIIFGGIRAVFHKAGRVPKLKKSVRQKLHSGQSVGSLLVELACQDQALSIISKQGSGAVSHGKNFDLSGLKNYWGSAGSLQSKSQKRESSPGTVKELAASLG